MGGFYAVASLAWESAPFGRSGSRLACRLDREPDSHAALRSRGADLLPPFGRETTPAPKDP